MQTHITLSTFTVGMFQEINTNKTKRFKAFLHTDYQGIICFYTNPDFSINESQVAIPITGFVSTVTKHQLSPCTQPTSLLHLVALLLENSIFQEPVIQHLKL